MSISAARVIVLVIALTASLYCQTKPAAFEVASIKPSEHATPWGRKTDASHAFFDYYQLMPLLRIAFHAERHQIIGPAWLDPERDAKHWEIAATIPEDGTPAQVPEMLKTLLVQRFGLVSHEEVRPVPVYALVAGPESPKLRKSQIVVASDGTSDPSFSVASTAAGFELKR